MDNDQMDVDQPSSRSRCPASSPVPPSSSNKRVGSLLTDAEVMTLGNNTNYTMKLYARSRLVALVEALQCTGQKDSFIKTQPS